jgi:DNA-binding NarL/FixJ family response regulator
LVRILIADDREPMRGALKTFVALNPEWTVCGEAGNANEAIAKAQELHPDLILMDYKMPDSNDLVAADGTLRTLPDIPIVMFTQFKTHELARRLPNGNPMRRRQGRGHPVVAQRN